MLHVKLRSRVDSHALGMLAKESARRQSERFELGTARRFDAVIIGSGFGGAMAAHRLIEKGARVLMIERGDWVSRGEAAWLPQGSLELTPHYQRESEIRCLSGGHGPRIGSYGCVGGPSVFYGCVSFRFRAQDFVGDPDVIADSGAAWPFRYDDLEPYYAEAERLLSIAGSDEGDPTAPHRSTEFPQTAAPWSAISNRLADAARALSLSPFSLPLAINHQQSGARAPCVSCRTCDTYACAIEAKNDVDQMMIRPLLARGLVLWPRSVALRLEATDRKIDRLHVYLKDRSEVVSVEADRFILAAGALGTPHLLLASQLDSVCESGHLIGSFLTRHKNAMVFGVFPGAPDKEYRFHKQVAIHDFYFGVPGHRDESTGNGNALRKLGGIQQVMTPPKELVQAYLPTGTKRLLGMFTQNVTGLLCIAEDQPQKKNRVSVDFADRDKFGLPRLLIEHEYSERDSRALGLLVSQAKRVLRKTGAWLSYTHYVKTFSHALGTVRMGIDPQTSPLDGMGKLRGIENLWVVDGSALPMSAGVNPSLTISANALRIADGIASGKGSP